MSNPRPIGGPLVANGKDHLLIYFVNGRKVRTKMMRAYKTARQVKQDAADIYNVFTDNFDRFKFIHVEIDDDAIVGDFASKEGATALAFFHNMTPLETSMASLNLEQISQDPRGAYDQHSHWVPPQLMEPDPDQEWD